MFALHSVKNVQTDKLGLLISFDEREFAYFI